MPWYGSFGPRIWQAGVGTSVFMVGRIFPGLAYESPYLSMVAFGIIMRPAGGTFVQ